MDPGLDPMDDPMDPGSDPIGGDDMGIDDPLVTDDPLIVNPQPPSGQQWLFNVWKDHDSGFDDAHRLCSKYHDAQPTQPGFSPPRLDGRLVARRGANFWVEIKTTFHQQIAAGMVFLAAPPGVPDNFATNIPVVWENGVGLAPGATSGWVEVQLPASAPVGAYELQVRSPHGQVLGSMGVIVLFNPWFCGQACPEHVGNGKLGKEFLEEYIGGENFDMARSV
jgi:hypothetical protein